MPADFSIKINRRDGALEITGPERNWVDAKLAELINVCAQPLDDESEGASHSEASESASEIPANGSRKRRAPRTAVSGTSQATRPARARRSAGRPQRNPELETQLTRDVLEAFTGYIDERRSAWDKKQTHQAAIIATFLQDELGWSGIDADDAYTVYRALSLDGPTNYKSFLQNAYGRDKFFMGVTDGKYVLSIGGEKFARNGARDA